MNRTWLSAALLTGLNCPCLAQEIAAGLKILVPDLPPGTRLMGFSLAITSGRIAALREAPAGWHIVIDNDPSWHATITANAVVGAAALSTDALASLFLLAPTPPKDRLGSDDRLKVSGSINVLKDGEVSTVKEPLIRLAPDLATTKQ